VASIHADGAQMHPRKLVATVMNLDGRSHQGDAARCSPCSDLASAREEEKMKALIERVAPPLVVHTG